MRVLGLPPHADELQFIDFERIQNARMRAVEVLDDEPLVAGFDVSGGGAAWNVIRFRRGLDARSYPAIRITGEAGRDRSVLVGRAAEVLRRGVGGTCFNAHNAFAVRSPVAALFVDSAFGAPVVERLHALGFRNVHEISFGWPSRDRHQANMRAYMWFRLKEWLGKGAIPDEEGLAGQLAGPGYHINTGGKLVIESKAEMAKRGVASPDDADALALTFVCNVAAQAVVAEPTYWRPPPVRGSRGGWLG